MKDQADLTIAAWLALFLFGIYLFTFSGRIHSYDGMSMFAVTESVVKRGEFNTNHFWTLFKARDELAPNGESYAKYGYGASLFAVPLYALALFLPGDLGLMQTTVLSSSIVIALAGALVFLTARRLRFSRGTSAITALLFGLATPALVYARQFWSEPFSLFTLFTSFYALLCFRDQRRARDALIAGLALGLAVATRVTNAALVPFFVWYGFGDCWRGKRERRSLVLFASALALLALSIAWYDWVRNGNLLATGYRANETFSNPLLLGLYGLLFSPGKGLFVYVPFFAVLPWSLGMMYLRQRREMFLIVAVWGMYLITFALWYYWWDGTNWSARFLVPTLPFLALATAPAVELATRATRIRTRAFAAIFGILCVLSIAIEILGLSIPPLTYWMRMYRAQLNPEGVLFIPQLSPFIVYLDLLKPKSLDLAWVRVDDGNVSGDWLVVVLTAMLVVFCSVMLFNQLRSGERPKLASRQPHLLWLIALVTVAVLALFSLYRYRGETRLGGNDGYRALLQTLQVRAQAHDVMVLNDDIVAPFFLNENHARIRWYGLSRDPEQFDDATRALLARLARQYARVWFAYDDVTAELPDPTRDWLEQSLVPVAQTDFDDGVHLILYETGAQ